MVDVLIAVLSPLVTAGLAALGAMLAERRARRNRRLTWRATLDDAIAQVNFIEAWFRIRAQVAPEAQQNAVVERALTDLESTYRSVETARTVLRIEVQRPSVLERLRRFGSRRDHGGAAHAPALPFGDAMLFRKIPVDLRRVDRHGTVHEYRQVRNGVASAQPRKQQQQRLCPSDGKGRDDDHGFPFAGGLQPLQQLDLGIDGWMDPVAISGFDHEVIRGAGRFR